MSKTYSSIHITNNKGTMGDGSFELEFHLAFEKGLNDEENIRTARTKAEKEREKERERKENERKNLVWKKYFPSARDSENKSSLQDALIKSASKGCRCLYFNFDRSDFTGWHNLVEGGYKNAHPVSLLDKLLTGAKNEGCIPSRVTWDIWNNGAFTVVFSW